MNRLMKFMPVPQAFGPFHFLSLLILFFIASALIKRKKEITNINDKYIIYIFLMIFTFGFIYKQYMFYKYGLMSKEVINKFSWDVFPWQFCDTPVFLLPIGMILEKYKKKRTNLFYTFLTIYGLFGGLMALLVPAGLFTNKIGTNIETIIHHGSMIIMSIYLYKTKRYDSKEFKNASILLIFFILFAAVLNISLNKISNNQVEAYYINLYKTTRLPVFNKIQSISYVLFITIYMGLFVLMGYLLTLLYDNAIKINKRYRLIYSKINKKYFKIFLYSSFVLLNLGMLKLLLSSTFNPSIQYFNLEFKYILSGIMGDFAVLCIILMIILLIFKKEKYRITAMIVVTTLISIFILFQLAFAKYYNVFIDFRYFYLLANDEPDLVYDTIDISLRDILRIKSYITFYVPIILYMIYYFSKRKFREETIVVRKSAIARVRNLNLIVFAASILVVIQLYAHSNYKSIYNNIWQLEASSQVLGNQVSGNLNFYLLNYEFGQTKRSYSINEIRNNNSNKENYTNLLGNKGSNILNVSDANNLDISPKLLKSKTKLNGILKDKNLLLIQIETLNNFVLGNEENSLLKDPNILPNLKKLMKQSYSIDNMFQSVGTGHSSDANYSILNGVFSNGNTFHFQDYPKNKYTTNNSLVHYFNNKNYSTNFIETSDPTFYDADKVVNGLFNFKDFYYYDNLKKYSGSDDKIHNTYYTDIDLEKDIFGNKMNKFYKTYTNELSDSAMIKLTSELLKNKTTPFFAQAMTLKPHVPFYEPENPLEIPRLRKHMSKEGYGYIRYLNYIDSIFKDIIQLTKKLPNTAFIIYSDHCATGYYKSDIEKIFQKKLTNEEFQRQRGHIVSFIHVPDDDFISSNEPVGLLKGNQNLVRTQADIYRTVVDLYFDDIKSNYYGANLLSKEKSYAIDAKRFNIFTDDFMILGNNALEDPKKYNITKFTNKYTNKEIIEIYKKIKLYKLNLDKAIRAGDLSRIY